MPYGPAGSFSSTDMTYLNRRTSSGLNAFEYPSGDLGFVVLHEQGHLDKLASMTPFTRQAYERAYSRNQAFFLRVEAETDRAACAGLMLGGRELVVLVVADPRTREDIKCRLIFFVSSPWHRCIPFCC